MLTVGLHQPLSSYVTCFFLLDHGEFITCPSLDVVCKGTGCQSVESCVRVFAFLACVGGLQVYLACSFVYMHCVVYHFVPSGSDGVSHHSTAAFAYAEYCVFCVCTHICVT
jgi:hypothetical protein